MTSPLPMDVTSTKPWISWLPTSERASVNGPTSSISGWESSIQNFCKDLYRTAVYLNPARKDYLNLYYAHRILKPHDNFNLLYIQATALDNPIGNSTFLPD